jgi:hypothetical protein
MTAQSEPSGQQMTDWTPALLRELHFEPVGQQKSEGNPDPHCWRLGFPPQVDACRREMCDACDVTASADATRSRVDILERRWKTDDGDMAVQD